MNVPGLLPIVVSPKEVECTPECRAAVSFEVDFNKIAVGDTFDVPLAHNLSSVRTLFFSLDATPDSGTVLSVAVIISDTNFYAEIDGQTGYLPIVATPQSLIQIRKLAGATTSTRLGRFAVLNYNVPGLLLEAGSGSGSIPNPLPVTGPLTDAQLRATPVPVSASSLPLPANAAQETGGHLASIDTKLTNPLPVSGPLTDTQLRATPVPVSGPLTDTQLRATPVPVSGPLTDTQLRASAVPVTERITTLPFTHAALSFSAAGDNTLVAAVGGQTVKVYRLFLVFSNPVNALIKSGATNLSGLLPFVQFATVNIDDSCTPEFITGVGEAFILNLDSSVQVSGWIQYIQS